MKFSQPAVILASQSVQRRNLLAATGLTFTTLPADLDEKAIASPVLAHRAESIATAKAHKIAVQQPAAIIIAADTFVVLGDMILEKPQSLAEAKDMLRRQSGQIITEQTGVCYLDPARGVEFRTTVVVQAAFRTLTDAEIDRYVATQPVLTWSGAFSPAYDAGMGLIAWVNGSLTAFTHGLPMEVVWPLLQESGVVIKS